MERIGRYKIVRELGRGAMGVVYHAIDPNIGRPVAIKTIQLGGGRKPEEQERLRERLFREARSAGILSHPGIVTIYDVEQHGDVAYIAMEFVDGPTLDQLISQPSPIPPEQMFSILGQTAVALDYAHQKGIVHRDIKPANIMIAADGTTKITDFGIAKITASDQFTMTGSIVGTPHYMSPEQVQGQPVDGRSDQFSLAVIAYELLTGEKPYTGEHLTTVVYKIVTEDPVAVHRLNPSLGGAIENVMRKVLSKRAENRYRTCQEFVDALEKACVATKGWKLMPRGGSLNEPTIADAPPQPGAVTLPPSRRAQRAARLGDATATTERSAQRKSGALTFILAILVVAGLIALIATQVGPTLTSTTKSEPTETAKSPEPNPPQPQPEPKKEPETAPAQGAAPAAAAAVEDPKPSALGPPAKQEPTPSNAKSEETAVPRKSARADVAMQPVTVISSPGGATATMDARPDTACTTPCNIDAPPGRHTFAVNLPGYGMERREVQVGSSPLELPAMVLRASGGTMMITSVPSGAAVSVNGKATGKTTPIDLPVPPGSYKVTVEKDGRQATQTVEVRGGISYLKFLLGQ